MPASLRIGLYNSIPDIGDDHLKSYVDYVQQKWNALNTGITLQIVAGKKYDPYGDLNKFLGTGAESFDLIETDMARAKELVGKVLEIKKGTADNEINAQRYIPATVDAVKRGNTYLGFPTLACGNFIIEIQQKNEHVVALDGTEYKDFIDSAEKAEDQMVYDGPCGKKVPKRKHARLLGGKIDDSAGWYLPFIYLDGVVDILGPKCIDSQIKDVLAGNPHSETVQRLRQFFGYFKNNCGDLDQENIEEDVVDGEDAYYFGFSEKLSVIFKKGNYHNIKATGVLSPPFGETNYVLVYTDALVLNKAKYEQGNDEYREAMFKFSKFFTSDQIRTDFVMGKDLGEGKIRYLLPPIKEFYESTENDIYKAYYKILKNGISAPAISETDRQIMENVLKPLVNI
ncbi:uncharacterized protein LOC130649260 [Hydractinia symbiolongicarpus]|uniref:uncharacterized protein LOC130649260 n=1 Tax=Hydractinia symbiolongicarpus TaxID=13093 RepID=UPI00254F235D|nr:uncharacterized protein LOC130649260 [Hydractinia symbiolongicarpus]